MIKIKDGLYQYKGDDFIDSGGFGMIFKGKNTQTDQDIAIKIIKQKNNESFLNQYLIQALNREIQIQEELTKTKIPFFVKIEDHFEEKQVKYLILELCNDTLENFFNKIQNPDQDGILEIIFQIGIGLFHLHQRNITHRDIKLENILIKDGIIKIADFGISTEGFVHFSNVGTQQYQSPELITSSKVNCYTNKVDVWALNTCLYKLLTDKFYFNSDNNQSLVYNILNKPFTTEGLNLNKDICDLLTKGFQKDPNNRPNIKEYISHKVFQKFINKYKKHLQVKNFGQNLQDSSPKTKLLKSLKYYFNNNIKFYKLSLFILKLDYQQLLVIGLQKYIIQNLLKILFCFMNQIVPSNDYFKQIEINQQIWEEIIQNEKFKQLMIKYEQIIEQIQKQLDEILKSLENKYSQTDYIQISETFQDLEQEISLEEILTKMNTVKDNLISRYPENKNTLNLLYNIQISQNFIFEKNNQFSMKKTQIPVMFNELENDLKSKTKTWEGGNTYHLQKQHIPGYQGFVPGVKSENLHGKTFSKITSDAFKMKENGQQKFDAHQTQYEKSFGQAKENQITIDEVIIPKTEVLQNPKKFHAYNRLPISGYTGHKPIYKNPLRKYQQVKQEWEQALNNQEIITLKNVNKNDIKKPIVGYEGFIPQQNSVDYHGKNFQDTVTDIKLKKLDREFQEQFSTQFKQFNSIKVMILNRYTKKILFFSTAVSLGYFSSHYTDDILRFYYSKIHFQKQQITNNEIFHTQSLLLKNIISIYILEEKDNEITYCYMPGQSSQGHFSVSHGGFTGSVVEYLARCYMKENKFQPLIKFDFYYKKPIFIYNYYKVTFKKNGNELKVEIRGQENDELYSYGKLEFQNSSQKNIQFI